MKTQPRTAALAFAERAAQVNALLLAISAMVQDRVETASRDWADVGDLATAAGDLELVRAALAGE